MLAAAKVTGENVTPGEVDTAIRQYYANLHTFREPKMSLAVAMAQAWVRRREILGKVGVLLAAGVLVWWLFLSPNARLTAKGQAHRQLERLSSEIARRSEVIRLLAKDPKVATMLDGFAQGAYADRRKEDRKELESIRDALADMETRLGEEYSVVAVPQDTVSGRNKNTIVEYPPDTGGKKIKAYFLFVQARKADGTVLPRRIESSVTAKSKVVTTWAEQIPEDVYERLGKDKLADGILNETAFAVKRKGMLDEEITMPGADGKTPLARMGRITGW
jgi:type II secretory pathway component PulM